MAKYVVKKAWPNYGTYLGQNDDEGVEGIASGEYSVCAMERKQRADKSIYLIWRNGRRRLEKVAEDINNNRKNRRREGTGAEKYEGETGCGGRDSALNAS